MSEQDTRRERPVEDAGTLQRDAQRRLSLEARFRQNDWISRFRAEVLQGRGGLRPRQSANP